MTSPEPFLPPEPIPAGSTGFFLSVSAIYIPQRIRAVDQAWVQMLAASFEEKGMDTPITVRPFESADPSLKYSLVIGAHRIAAATSLNWSTIRATVRHLDDDEARLAEIEENLMRRELDKLDFGIFYIERKEIEERLGLRATHGGDRRSDASAIKSTDLSTWSPSPRFTAEVAEKIGRSERTVQRAIAAVKALDPDTIRLIRGTPLANNESKLQDLGREGNPIKRRNLAQAMLDGAKTVHAARVAIGDEPPPPEGGDPQGVALAKLHDGWGKANEATRLEFLHDIKAAYLTVQPSSTAQTPLPAPSRGGRKPAKSTH